MTLSPNHSLRRPLHPASDPVVQQPSLHIWEVLAVTRFCLALIVAAYHIQMYFGSSSDPWKVVGIVGNLNGQAAVVGFLLISGFSICHSLVSSPRNYLWRRFLRIYPLYLTGILLTCWWCGDRPSGPMGNASVEWPPGSQIFGQILMLDGVVTRTLDGNLALWTIGLEWWCYMAAPLLLAVNKRLMLPILVILAAAHLSWIFLGPKLGGHYMHTAFGLKIWFMSVFWVLGFWYYLNCSNAGTPCKLVLAVWLLTGVNQDNLGAHSQITLMLSCMALIAAPHVVVPRWLCPFCTWLGNVSYPLYLLHLPVYTLFYHKLHLENGPLLILGSMVAAMIAHLVIEQPLKRILSTARLNRAC